MTNDEIYLGSQVVREFPYRPGWGMIVLGLVMFAACNIVLSIQAIENDRGIIINGLIRFGPDGATVFYWALATGSVLFTGLFLFLLFVRVTSVARIVVTTDGLYVPKRPLLIRYDFTAFSQITAIAERKISRQRFLTICSAARDCTVMAHMLPAKSDLDALCELIREHVACAERS